LTNIHFEYEGKPLNEFMELSLVPDLPFEASLSIVQDNYNERTIRAHFLRMKELISPPGTGFKGIGEEWGIAPGSTLAEFVQAQPAPNPNEMGNYFSQPLPDLSSVIAPYKAIFHPVATVKSLLLSQWNPPPPHRRTQGDLLYLTFTSLEGDLYHITGHIRGFFVSRSTNQKFDPTPKTPQKLPTHSLLTLLKSLSLQFSLKFGSLHPTDSGAEILADAPLANALPAFPWLVQVPQVCADSARIQRPWLEILAEGQSNLRDWNDEIQSTRALPTTGVRERLVRERMLQKSLTDFTACATYAAMLVRRGELVPLDPVPETHEHGDKKPIPEELSTGTMWHYNNIFLSLGGEDVLGSFEAEGGGEASRAAVGKDVTGVARVNSLLLEWDEKDEKECGLCTLGTVVVDYLGERLVAQSVVPGIFQQAPDPAGKKEEESAPAGAHKIVYGGVDNGEKVFADPDFDQRFKKIMDKLHIKQHDVWEIPAKKVNGEVKCVDCGQIKCERKKRTLRTSLETKGLRGADGRNYVLDLYKLAPIDIAFLDEHHSEDDYHSYPHRMAFLRNECVDAFWQSKLRVWGTEKLVQRAKQIAEEKKNSKSEGGESNGTEAKEEETPKENERLDISDFKFALNPDVFSPSQAPVTEEEKKRLEEDEADVRACCAFLREKLIPGLMEELGDGSGGWPVDGKSLTNIMHRNGVNVRFLGKVVELCGEDPKLHAVKVLSPKICLTSDCCTSRDGVEGRQTYFFPIPSTIAVTGCSQRRVTSPQLSRRLQIQSPARTIPFALR
jgi:protein TIF31